MPRELTQLEKELVTKELDGSRYIGAVKVYRKYSGKGLKECKMAVDDMVAEVQRLEPEKYSDLSKRGTGCMAVLALMLTTNVLLAIISLLK